MPDSRVARTKPIARSRRRRNFFAGESPIVIVVDASPPAGCSPCSSHCSHLEFNLISTFPFGSVFRNFQRRHDADDVGVNVIGRTIDHFQFGDRPECFPGFESFRKSPIQARRQTGSRIDPVGVPARLVNKIHHQVNRVTRGGGFVITESEMLTPEGPGKPNWEKAMAPTSTKNNATRQETFFIIKKQTGGDFT